MSPAALVEIGWSDTRCWCGRVAAEVRLTPVSGTPDRPAHLVLVGSCTRHATTEGGAGPDLAKLVTPDPPSADGHPGLEWRDLHTAMLVLGTASAMVSEALVVTDGDGRCRLTNAAWSDLSGLSSARSHGLGWMSALGVSDRDRLRRQLVTPLTVRVRIQLRSHARRSHGSLVEMTARPIIDFDRAVVGHLFSFVKAAIPDPPALASAELESLDVTTRLPDRGQFLDLVHQALDSQDRATTSAVVVVNLEYSGELTTEREAQDLILMSLASRLTSSVRPGDLVSRTAVGQFAVLCAEVASFNEVIGVAERLRTVTAELLEIPDGGAWSAASVGVAFPHLPGETAERLLAKAESAAALARSTGGQRVEVIIGTGPGSSDAAPARSMAPIDVDLDLRDPGEYGIDADLGGDSGLQEHLSTASGLLQEPPPH